MSAHSVNEEGTNHTLPFFVHTFEELSGYITLDSGLIAAFRQNTHQFRVKIPPYYLGLMDDRNPYCPIKQQAVPSLGELGGIGTEDPLGEAGASLTPALIRKHPNRAVFLVSSRCAMYCRFCNRKRLVGRGWEPETYREESLRAIEDDPQIREVILSGGDPLMLAPDHIHSILARLKAIKRIDTIRISTRIPVVFPAGLTRGHLEVLRGHAPLWIVVHINHPKELTPEFRDVVRRIREGGNILISQTVLLRNVNDCPHVLSELFHGLVASGVKPYYLFQLDEVTGAAHFKVRLERGIEIMRILRKISSGLAMPQYALDIPGGLGKVPVDYTYVQGRAGELVMVESIDGKSGAYLDNGEESRCTGCGICGKIS